MIKWPVQCHTHSHKISKEKNGLASPTQTKFCRRCSIFHKALFVTAITSHSILVYMLVPAKSMESESTELAEEVLMALNAHYTLHVSFMCNNGFKITMFKMFI